MTTTDPGREFLRHTLATLAYRDTGKAVRHAPPGFSAFRAGSGSRSAGQILAHMCDLFDWALALAEGEQRWHDTPPHSWDDDCARFFTAVEAFDGYLAGDKPLGRPVTMLFQGPVADALTHAGQIAMLRRLAASPVRGENYARAEIVAGRLGATQAAPRMEFDKPLD